MTTIKAKYDTVIAFKHPCYKDINVFIGEEMPYWIKKCVNHLESSSNSDTTRNIKFRGKYLNLEIVEKVWRSRLYGINVIRT